MSRPLFSVVIPTRDRNALLAACLDRLAPGAQAIGAEHYEVLVSDDSASESARHFLLAHYPWTRWVAGPQRGPAINRNSGARGAIGDYLVFIDDDCVPEPTLLSAYRDALRDGVATYEGRITCNEGVTSPRQTAPVNLTGGALWSCNFAMRRDTFERIGGFDERFPIPHMEDVDLRERILAAGHTIDFVPAASVDHPPRRLPWGWRLGKMHRAGVLYMALHPPFRGLPWFLQNQIRARLSHIRRFPKGSDSMTALFSIPLETMCIIWHWQSWTSWARRVARAA